MTRANARGIEFRNCAVCSAHKTVMHTIRVRLEARNLSRVIDTDDGGALHIVR